MPRTRYIRARLFLAVVVAMSPWVALAQPAGDGPPPRTGPFSLTIGAGGLVAPAYPGATKYQTIPLPSFDASYEDTEFVSFPDILRIDALRLLGGGGAGLSAGPLVRYRFGRNVKDDPGQLHGLGNLSDTVELGGFVAYQFSQALSLRANIAQSVEGKEGLLADLGISYAKQFGPLSLIGTPSITYMDRQYSRSYYGIDSGQSAASGRPVYQPGAGIERVNFSATAVMPLTAKIALIGTATYGRLVGQAANSPIVRQGGTPNQFVGALFVTYSFF